MPQCWGERAGASECCSHLSGAGSVSTIQCGIFIPFIILQSNLKINTNRSPTSRSVFWPLLLPGFPGPKFPDRVVLRGGHSRASWPCAQSPALTWDEETVPSCTDRAPQPLQHCLNNRPQGARVGGPARRLAPYPARDPAVLQTAHN